jgi:hypothetical protein
LAFDYASQKLFFGQTSWRFLSYRDNDLTEIVGDGHRIGRSEEHTMARPVSSGSKRALFSGLIALVLLTGCSLEEFSRFGAQRAALTPPPTTSDAEAVFAEAYRLEQHAAFVQALQYYNLVIDRFPASPLVDIARERVGRLAGQQAVAAPETSALVPGDYACTVEGLYPNKARWCGVVRQMRSPYFLIEVTELHLNTWAALWFSRSTCTGDRTLTWFSQGSQVWVPRGCLAEPSTTG